MTVINLGIIGGGQLGSMLATAAKKLNIKTIVYCDDKNAVSYTHLRAHETSLHLV